MGVQPSPSPRLTVLSKAENICQTPTIVLKGTYIENITAPEDMATKNPPAARQDLWTRIAQYEEW